MNKELEKQAFDYNAKLKRHPMSDQDLQDILCDFAEEYATIQTEALKKEIEELKKHFIKIHKIAVDEELGDTSKMEGRHLQVCRVKIR